MNHIFRDETYMKRALLLAKRGAGKTSPNPMVGAVLVRGGTVVGEGFHKGVGLPHAEINALRDAGAGARGATLYINLEPCRHFGKTPPCTKAIIKAGVRRVVFSVRDPHRVAGGGIEELRRAGILVSVGILETAARDLNEVFFTFHAKKRPFIVLKYAASLDGRLATQTGNSKWITHERARAYARRLRGTYQALLVGIETILADDPHLGARTKGLPDPLRIILDSRLRIPLSARVLRDSHVIIATTKRASIQKRKQLEQRGIRVLTFAGARISLKPLLTALHAMNIVSIMVEGGGAVLGSFIDGGFFDKVYSFYAPIFIGGKNSVFIGGQGINRISDAPSLARVSVRRFGSTVLVVGSLR